MTLTCVGCGACCNGCDGRVPFAPGEQVPTWHQAEHDATPVVPGGGCPWYQGGECRHYEERASICAAVEIGGQLCLMAREQHVKAQDRLATRP